MTIFFYQITVINLYKFILKYERLTRKDSTKTRRTKITFVRTQQTQEEEKCRVLE